MVTVIVQGIPVNHNNPTQDEEKLNNLFTKYCRSGAVKCSYLWSSKAHRRLNSPKVYDNFAHMIFESKDDAKRASYAAANHEIKLDEIHVLTVTLVEESSATIEQLADCLEYIFLKLDMERQLAAEKVCKQWESIVVRTVRKLDFFEECWKQESKKFMLTRYGKYLEDITFCAHFSSTLYVVQKHCKNLRELSLCTVGCKFDDVVGELSMLFSALSKLEWLCLRVSDKTFRLNCLYSLPKRIKHIHLVHEDLNASSGSLDLSKFSHLEGLSFDSFDFNTNYITGWETLDNLNELGLRACEINSEMVPVLQSFTKLKTLEISSTVIDEDIVLNILRNNPNVEDLVLAGEYYWTDELTRVAPNLKKLKLLYLSGVTLNFANQMPLLRNLICIGCENVTNEALGRAVQLSPKLKYLHVNSPGITADFLSTANSALKCRQNGVRLKVKTNVTTQITDMRDFNITLVKDPVEVVVDDFVDAENNSHEIFVLPSTWETIFSMVILYLIAGVAPALFFIPYYFVFCHMWFLIYKVYQQ